MIIKIGVKSMVDNQGNQVITGQDFLRKTVRFWQGLFIVMVILSVVSFCFSPASWHTFYIGGSAIIVGLLKTLAES